ncbi:MAG: toprim domain-containing protein, partial [Pseudobacter sp.]|uniref:toprim domain-containing protein n=1 Tax=Pseudobacter sp. TaxID=2045420 RepID=UPI003F8124FA
PTSSLSVFEGFMDFLSYLTLRMFTRPDMNYLILNSLSFFDKELPKMQQYGRVHLFLDNDQAANKITANALSVDPQKFQDERKLYQNYKDLNEWCQQQGKTNRQQQKP